MGWRIALYKELIHEVYKKNKKLSSLEIAERVESVGASLGTDAATDYFLLSLKTVTSDFDQYFANSNRFGSNSIPHTRLVVYSESAFQGPLAKNQNHYFEGFNDSQI